MKINNPRMIFIDGEKSITLDQYPDEAWTWLSGGPDKREELELLSKVAWPYRAINMLQQVMVTIPFSLVKKSGKDFDTSLDWQNKIGFMPNPKRLISLLCSSLNARGKAYLSRENTIMGTKGLRYLQPDSVSPKIKPDGEITFERSVNGKTVPMTTDDIVYFWLPDWAVEIGEPTSYPAKAAFAAAGILFNLDEFVGSYFRRGAIKPTLLSVSGNPSAAEREKLESWWKSVITGMKNAFGSKIVNADAIKATVIGEGLESLSDKDLTTTQREDIATAFGIPQTMLWSNAANYATAQQDVMSMVSYTSVPMLDFIFDTLNDQIFASLGLRMESRPNEMDIFQEDENRRAESFANYVNAGMKQSIAAQILGIDLPEGIEYEDLDGDQEPEPPPPPEPEPVQQEPDQVGNEMRTWERFAIARLGKANKREFVCEFIPEDMQERIRERLSSCTTPEQVKAAFLDPQDEPDYQPLINEIKQAVSLLREGELS